MIEKTVATIEKTATDTAVKTAQKVEKGVEKLVHTVWDTMEAAARQKPSELLSDRGVRALQGRE